MKWASRIVAWLAPPEWRESMMGDLAEERHRRQLHGRRAGGLWAIASALALVMALRRGRRASLVGSASNPWTGALGGVAQDVRLALRSLRASPGFTMVAWMVLVLGIGAGTAIFSVVDAVVLRKPAFESPDRLVVVGENFTDGGARPRGYVGSMAAPNYLELRDQQTVFSSIAATHRGRQFIVRDSGEPEALNARTATASLFDVLRVRPQLGRFFTADEEAEGRNHILVISDGLWHRRFGGDPGIVGKTMSFEGESWEIVGVLPRGFAYPVQLTVPVDVWAPYTVPARERIRNRQETGRSYNLQVVARLKDGVTMEQARSDVTRIFAGLATDSPDWFGDIAPAFSSLHDSVTWRARDYMLLLLGSVGFVLLIACANVANLMLARATTRSREIVVRSALGASRWRIARALLVESLVLSGAGLLGALLLAAWGVSLLRSAMPASIPRLAEVGVDLRVLLVATAAAVVTGLVCGIGPALQLSRPDLNAALREGGRSGTTGSTRQRLRSGLLVAEVALACVLLVGAGLFVSSFVRLMSVDLGIDHRNVLVAGLFPRIPVVDAAGLARAEAETQAGMDAVLARMRATPGVEAVAAISSGSPLSGSWRTNAMTVPGKPPSPDEVQIREVTPEYADVVKVALRRGRYIRETDAAGAPLVVVLNEEAARRYFDGQDPIGTSVTIDEAERVVVGVVADVHVLGPEAPTSPEAYLPLAQRPAIGVSILVRTTADPDALAPVLRSAILEAVPDVPVTTTTLEATLGKLTSTRRFNMLLVSLFGVLAIVIATVGMYGVMAYIVTQRTQEIGVRMALGAEPSRVLLMVLGRATMFMAVGTAIGLAGAWLLGGTVEAYLFAVGATDPLVYASVGGLLTAAGILAAIVPALRAARVDPIIALRAD